ncbi:ExbD/TolR family protein [Fusobacterium perfoetens]|uniref:ExbD/TolR family protein n=1 Tax=Fusobacterium perfoetens TaxID=852 RepID=UPI00048428F5|nr:biopolymer transporter ExbD [Fusobacterium perfoetens]MCI6152398.1 biopolymer transporter ExbD [Fusobacterium perfoetens]MDY3236997.1 biopolymer transporter ExbD [Fusobacterium perfoetens]
MKIERYRRRNNKNIILEMTPLIDVVFLLLIFFLVATTFEDVDTGIKIDLPQSTIREIKTVKEVQLSLTNTKEIFIKYQEGNESKKILVNKANLQRKLAQILSNSDNKAVVISGDKTLDYGYIVEIMTLSKEAGAEQLDIDTIFEK